ncbi:MAG: biotin/lipoate A/B protein ligase family protein [Candidatus Altiarchaeota archaeon]
MECRFIDSGVGKAYFNMGLDEAILEHVSDSRSPATLRFYGWAPRAVSIGYFQSMREEVDVDACFKDGVDVVRRITGGGAVYHDRELTYSYIAKEDAVPDDILESYRLICGGLIRGFNGLGLKAEFAPLNDILSGGRKISGNAQTRRMGCVMQHGTILLDVDVDRMFRYLKVPSEKMRDKAVKDVKERVTSLKHLTGKEVPCGKAAEAFKKGFAEALKLRLKPASPTPSELAQAQSLAECKYFTLEWNDKR